MEHSVFEKYPEPEQMKQQAEKANRQVLKVNGHFHTPFSFSAFTEIGQVFEMARKEDVKVLGINDFYTTDGYAEFNVLAQQYEIFPLFNIEFMSLQKDLQAKGVRVNDPNNPGRTYFSGKGLKFPVSLGAEQTAQIAGIQDESNRQTAEMTEKLNAFLKELGMDFRLSFGEIKAKYAKTLVRERHLAKALRIAVQECFPSAALQKETFEKLFSGKPVHSAMTDFTGLENEIRGNLLKSGGRAFVPEDDKAFLSLEQVIDLIIHAGGIPCYPVLLDNPKGEFTDYEGNYENLYRSLTNKKVWSLELIPGRNKPEILEGFVNFFNEKGFVITFGTEHNTPQLDPVTVLGGDGKEISEAMQKIGYEGACVVAAHQYLIAKGEEGYLDGDGRAKVSRREAFIGLGNAVIKYTTQMNTQIADLIEISRFYGKQKDYVLAGGGNTSFKDGQYLWIKASGFSLSTIGEEGFARLDRSLLNQINTKTYSGDALLREEEIKNDLMKSRVEPEKGQRPSVETSLHNLIDFAFVVHTHSTKVNGLMCSNQAAEKTAALFGDEVLYIGYEDPGYILFKAVEKEILNYREKKGKEPAVIFLQNHGVFVGADTIDEIKEIYNRINAKLDQVYGQEPVIENLPVSAKAAAIVPAVRMMVSDGGLKTVSLVNNSVLDFYQRPENYGAISAPFTPDGIVYANSSFIYAPFNGDADAFLKDIRQKIDHYRHEKGKLPKVIFASGLGVLLIADHAQGTEILRDVVTDSCRIARFAAAFGGQHPMTRGQIEFIENWEVEQYRSKISLGATAGRVDRKVVIVTGGAQGFGAGIVEQLMEHGANVVIADLNEEKGSEFAGILNRVNRKNKALFVKADVSKAESVENLVYETVVQFGGLDVFISNAGILRAGGLDEMTPETFRLMTMVNYEAYFLCAKYASVVMKLQHQNKPDHFMDIIQINSKSGLKGSNKNFAYAGGKFGGIGLTESFALELMPYHIKVNSICPGNFYDGPLWADPERGLFVQYLKAGKVPGAKTADDVKKFYEAQVPAGRGCTPLDVMRAIFYVIEQEYETGQAVPVTGGQNMLK